MVHAASGGTRPCAVCSNREKHLKEYRHTGRVLHTDCLCPQDSESVDRYIQAALTDLYPPVLARSSSVLRQVLSVSDSCYQGDGLRYLLHFLLPAKHFLQNLQQDACVQYCGVLFCHDGWPLCIHEKIVIQLCPLDVHLLRPGDFYLQVSPPTAPPQGDGASRRRSGALTTRLLLGSVSPCRHHVEQQEVPAVALPSLFSMAWLDSVNRERERRGAAPLQRCVLSTAGDVFRVPWEDLVYPQLLGRPRASSERNAASFAENRDAGQESRFLPHSQMDQSETSSDGDSEGEYVELTELPLPCFSPQKGSLTQSISQQRRCAAQPAAQSTKQPAAQTTAQPAAQNATQPAAQTPTQPMAQNTTQPTAVAQTTAQPAAQTTTHPAVQNTTQPAAVPSHCDTNGSVTHQLTAVDAHSVETHSFSLHEERRFALGGEELLQDLRGAVTLTSYSSAPTVVEHTEGTKSHRRLNTADSCMEQEEEESVSVSDAEKEVKEEQLRERRWSDEEEEDESRGTGEEEVELEEEVRVIVVPQRQARKEEEAEAMKEEQHRGGTRQEKKHLTKDFYSEKHTQQTELRGSYCEENTQHSICEETQQKHTNSYLIYSENTNKIDPLHLYSENTTHHSYSQNFCSENSRNVENSNFDNTAQTQLPSSYCESVAPLTLPEESWDSRTGLCEEASTPPVTSSAVPPFIEKSNLRQKEEEGAKKEVQEERSCKEVGAGGATKRQSEGLCRVSVQLSSCSQTQSRLNCVLLNSGAVCLPGTADRGGRPLLTVCCSSAVWSHSASASGELLHLLLYYTSTLRKELRASGLTVLLDARKAAPPIVLLSALRALQEQAAVSIHSLLVLTHTDSCPCLDKPAATQVEVLTSVKSLQKHVELRQLPEQFGGSFSFNQSSWVTFRQRVELLINQCDDVINLLRKNINILHTTALPVSAQDAELLLSRYEAMMRDILGDSQLARLQQEGGASLLWLRRKEGGVAPAQRAAVEVATCLYEKVDELLHHLVALSNTRTQQLSFVVDFRGREDDLSQVSCWLKDFGETRLKLFEESEDSVELLVRKRQQFKQFYTTAQEYCRLGDEVLADLRCGDHVTSGDLQVFGVKVQVFTSELATFSQRLCKAAGNLQESERLYRFFDQAYSWALAGMRHLAGVTMDECMLPERCQAVISCLEEYYRQHPPIPDGRYQEMRASASKLRGERGLRQWSFAWSKCQETKKMFDRKMEAAVRTRDSALRQRSDSLSSRSSASSRKTLPDLFGVQDDLACSPEENASLPVTSMPKGIPLLQRLFRSASSEESSDRGGALSSPPSLPHLVSSPTFPTFSSFSSGRGPQLRKTQSSDCPFTPEMPRRSPGLRLHGEPQRRGNTGVFIRGLEVSSNETSDLSRCARTPAHVNAGSPTLEPQPRGSKLCHVVQELVCTEREYVRSLRYILHHYVPEMQSDDVPQELRGKRSLVFGNLHKLLDFHAQFFLRELEACWKHPHRVPHCFLRHQEQFGLYALYSKNKPKSDILLANHGHFFRRKQLELGDKMDLSSYLLKPIQRMSKYALLLCDLIKEVGVAQEAELAVLQSATSMVKFQLRHGNDLLAMDAIRDCDVNLKEQGQLVRQDHFTVWIGRRKSQRHIFLFEELVLFSKPKKVQGGLDLFLYKHSFKTADVGLTESTGDSGLRFEIWFRRRTSKNQTFILQASSAEVRQAWTGDIARILWTQATRNKEMRLKEMVSMGVGNKPFLDIQPSEAAISDRAVHYIMKSRGTRTRASIAVSAFDHAHPFTPGAVTSDLTASGPSSCSLLGPLNLHMFSQSSPSPPVAEGSISTSCIEEDEQEIEISSQRSMTTESSGSSSRCLSSSTGSDSGCISSNLQEALPEEPSSSDHRHMERFVHSSTESASTDHILRVPIEDAAAAVGPATVI